MLETKQLTVRFGGHVAVNAVSCAFKPGTLTAIVGPNGAGKTTYFNLISGQIKATAGEVLLNGASLAGMSPSARTRAGLGRAFQLTNLFPNLTVLENVRLAVQAARPGAHLRGLNLWSIWSDHKALTQLAHEVLEAVAMVDKKDTKVAGLPHGDQRKLEVAKTKTILLVEHKMDVVRELADRIIVLHNGSLVADGEPADVIALPVVQEAYLGVAPAGPAAAVMAGEGA
jgi:branched-chain amino acid transport system ATP-binding protein